VWVKLTQLSLSLSLARVAHYQPLQILNNDGVVANVVHQYNRYGDVKDTFDKRNRYLDEQSFLFNATLTSIELPQ
jgi:hypothetical protein